MTDAKGSPWRAICTLALTLTGACSGPPLAEPQRDVPTYRGDSARTGVMPGPGPTTAPPLAWSFQTQGPIRSSPAVMGRMVFVASADGIVHALKIEDGTERWRSALGAEAGAASPLVIEGRVVVGDRAGVIHALATETGAEHWATRADGPIAGATAAAGGSIFAATETGVAYALEPGTGDIRWQAAMPGGMTNSLAATNELVYASASGGSLVAFRTADGTPAWTARLAPDGNGGTPTVAGGLVYAPAGLDGREPAHRALVVLDASDGTERWRRTSPAGEVLYAPAVRDGTAWIVSEDETVVSVDATSGDVRWIATTGAANDALPSVWGTSVYVATTGGSLQALDTDTGTLEWQVEIVGIPYAPVVAGGLVLVGTNVGLLYAFGEPIL